MGTSEELISPLEQLRELLKQAERPVTANSVLMRMRPPINGPQLYSLVCQLAEKFEVDVQQINAQTITLQYVAVPPLNLPEIPRGQKKKRKAVAVPAEKRQLLPRRSHRKLRQARQEEIANG